MTRAAFMAALHDCVKPGGKANVLEKWDTYTLDLGYWRAKVYYQVSKDYLQNELAQGGYKHLGDVAIARVLMVCFNHFRLKGDIPSYIQFPRTLLLSQQGKIEALHAFAEMIEALP